MKARPPQRVYRGVDHRQIHRIGYAGNSGKHQQLPVESVRLALHEANDSESHQIDHDRGSRCGPSKTRQREDR